MASRWAGGREEGREEKERGTERERSEWVQLVWESLWPAAATHGFMWAVSSGGACCHLPSSPAPPVKGPGEQDLAACVQVSLCTAPVSPHCSGLVAAAPPPWHSRAGQPLACGTAPPTANTRHILSVNHLTDTPGGG